MKPSSKLFSFVFLRHGESEANLVGIFQGQTDYALTDNGQNQVRLLAARWAAEGRHFDAIISSPLLRARQTAEIIASHLDTPVELEPDWMERNTGKFTGMDRQQASLDPDYKVFFTPYQSMGITGEGDFELFIRAGKAITKLLKKPLGAYLVVSHGGILNQAMHVIVGVTPQANGQGVNFAFWNTGFSTLAYDPNQYRWTITGFNDHAHINSL